MIFINKPIVITYHAKERFQQRRVNMNNITKKNYKKLGIELKGKVAVKVHSGEEGNEKVDIKCGSCMDDYMKEHNLFN